MPRGYRSLVAAIAGLILIGAGQPSKQPARSEQSQVNKDKAAALSNMAVGSPARPPQDSGCKAGQDNRNSDLCAQWKAADAANDAAKWNWWQMIAGFFGLLVGAGTLFFAARAAHWAKEAASHTQTGANEAKRSADAAENAIIESQRIGEAQTRCYITGVSAKINFLTNGQVGATCIIKNTGQSPAIDLIWTGQLKFLVSGNQLNVFDEDTSQALDKVYYIGAGLEEDIGPIVFKGVLPNVGQPSDFGQSNIYVSLDVSITAFDVFGKKVKITESFHVMNTKDIAAPLVLQLTRGHRMIAKKQE
jgi:hypothetical protein